MSHSAPGLDSGEIIVHIASTSSVKRQLIQKSGVRLHDRTLGLDEFECGYKFGGGRMGGHDYEENINRTAKGGRDLRYAATTVALRDTPW